MNWPPVLSRIWKRFFSKDPKDIGRNDPLARYLIDKRHFSPLNQRVKPGAFLPEPTGETSVYLIKYLSEEEIWTLGTTYIEITGRRIRARAELLARAVEHAKLRILPDDPPPRHAKIVGWSSEKDEQKACALELAQSSVLKLRP